jgi:biotin synthase
MSSLIENFATKVLRGGELTPREMAVMLPLLCDAGPDQELLDWAARIREHHKGRRVLGCSIINAKSGNCTENCTFCSQSVFNRSPIATYPFVGVRAIEEAYLASREAHAHAFSIVISGREVSDQDVSAIVNVVKRHQNRSPRWCASLGAISASNLAALKSAGVWRIHHNLETSREFFPHICTTHSFDEKIRTIRAARSLGFSICSGGLFGIGESWADRVSLAYELKALDVDAVPINFLHPIEGTALEDQRDLTPRDCLLILAIFRFILPTKDILVCGGRQVNLGEKQSQIFHAGANGIMIGDYLTTKGTPIADDHRMIADLGFHL